MVVRVNKSENNDETIKVNNAFFGYLSADWKVAAEKGQSLDGSARSLHFEGASLYRPRVSPFVIYWMMCTLFEPCSSPFCILSIDSHLRPTEEHFLKLTRKRSYGRSFVLSTPHEDCHVQDGSDFHPPEYSRFGGLPPFHFAP